MPIKIPSAKSAEIVIIGSGIAGLAAGQLLLKAGHNPLILDKGRRVGGRMSTRRAGGFLFNHGAQFVTARSAAFSAVCARAEKAGRLAKWPLAGRADAFSGTPAMRGLAEFMAEGLTIRQQAEVQDITRVKQALGQITVLFGCSCRRDCDHLPPSDRYLSSPQLADFFARLPLNYQPAPNRWFMPPAGQ